MKPDHKYPIGARHASELAKLTTGMLVGILALMTFLLSVGLTHPKVLMEVFIYASFICIGLSLIVYEIGSLLGAKVMQLAAETAPKEAEAAKRLKAKQDQTTKSLKTVHLIQRLLFILTVIAVVGFGISAIALFFPAAQASSPAASAAAGSATP